MLRSNVLLLGATAVLAAILLPGQGGAGATGGRAAASARPAGTIVALSDANLLTAIDVASGRRTTRRVRSLASCGAQLYVTGGHVIFAGVRDGRTVVFSLPVSLDGPPTRLGEAHAFVPSATDGRVWLAGVDCDRSDMVGVREVTVDGRVTASSAHRVPASWVSGAVHGGLVLQRGRELFVWDPRTGFSGRRLGLEAVTGTHGDLLFGCTERSDCRELEIFDTQTSRAVAARPSARYRLELDASFAPDGSRLAVAAFRARRWRIAVVDTRTGSHRIVPASRTRTYPDPSWSPSSGWLFARSGTRGLVAYRPGAQRAVTLPFRLARGALAFVAG